MQSLSADIILHKFSAIYKPVKFDSVILKHVMDIDTVYI